MIFFGSWRDFNVPNVQLGGQAHERRGNHWVVITVDMYNLIFVILTYSVARYFEIKC